MIKIKKCELVKLQVELLRHIVDKNGVRVDQKKIEVIFSTPQPKCQRDLRSFLERVGC